MSLFGSWSCFVSGVLQRYHCALSTMGLFSRFKFHIWGVNPHFSQSSVARPFKCRPIRPRGLKGTAGILDSMSKSLEGARPYRVDGWIGANE